MLEPVHIGFRVEGVKRGFDDERNPAQPQRRLGLGLIKGLFRLAHACEHLVQHGVVGVVETNADRSHRIHLRQFILTVLYAGLTQIASDFFHFKTMF